MDLETVALKCLEKDPARRPQSAREVLQALDGVTTGSRPATALHARVRWIAGSVGAALVITALIDLPFGPGKAIDTDKYFVVSADTLANLAAWKGKGTVPF